MKQKAHDKPEPIQAQGLQGQTLKPGSGADTEPSCRTAARIPRAKARPILANLSPGPKGPGFHPKIVNCKRKTRRALCERNESRSRSDTRPSFATDLVAVAPVPVFFFIAVVSLGEVYVVSMGVDFPPLVVHDFVVVPIMIIVMIGVVVLDSRSTADRK